MFPALFYANALIEGPFHTGLYLAPDKVLGRKSVGEDAMLISGIFAPMCIASSFVSVLMAKQEDNVAKQLFSVTWLVYHMNATKNVAQAVMKGEMKWAPFVVMHVGFTLGFCYYLKETGFSLSLLSPI